MARITGLLEERKRGQMEGSSGTRGHGCLSATGPPGSPPLTLFHLSFVQTADDQPCDKGRLGICPLCAWTRPLFCGMSKAGGACSPHLGVAVPLRLLTMPLPALPAGSPCSLRLQSWWGRSPSPPAWHAGLSLPWALAGLTAPGPGRRQET